MAVATRGGYLGFPLDGWAIIWFATGMAPDSTNPVLFADARLLIRDGDVLLYRAGWKPSNLLISRCGGTPYCHAGMAVWCGSVLCLADTVQWRGGRVVVLGKQVRRWPGRWDVFRPRQPYSAGLAAREIMQVVGRHYGWGNLIVSALRHTRYISRWLPPLTDDELNSSAPFCSQAVSRACRAGGRDPRPNAADIATEPGHLADPVFAEYLFSLYWVRSRLPDE